MSKQSKAQLTFYSPEDLHGYVLIQEREYQKLETWEIKVEERIHDENGYRDTLVFVQRVLGQSYFKLPEKYRNGENHCFVTISARDINGDIIEEELIEYVANPDGSTYQNNYDQWICNGWQYAYDITSHRQILNGEISNTGYLSLDSYISQTDPRFFVYYSSDTWHNNFEMIKERHGLPNEWSSNYYNWGIADNIKIKKLVGGVFPVDDLRDWDGQVVTTIGSGTLYGVRKDISPWRSMVTNTVPVIESDWSIWNAVNNMNQFADPSFEYYELSELECIGYDDPGVDNPAGGNYYVFEADELVDIISLNTINFNPENDIFDYFSEINAYLEINNGTGSDIPVWISDQIKAINIFEMTSGGQHKSLLHRDSIVDENGNIIVPSFIMDKGLYSIGYTFTDNSHCYEIVDVENQLDNSIDLSDFFNINIFPVPITGNCFNLSIEGSKSDKIKYNLFDTDGHLLYHENILYKNESMFERGYTIKMCPRGLPDGVLINQFIFSDGSTLSIQSLKE